MPFVPKPELMLEPDKYLPRHRMQSMSEARDAAAKAGFKNESEWLQAIKEEDRINDTGIINSLPEHTRDFRAKAIRRYAEKHGMDKDAAGAVFSRVAATGKGEFVGGDAEDKVLYAHYKGEPDDPFGTVGSTGKAVPRPTTRWGAIPSGGYGASHEAMEKSGMTEPAKRAQD